jgi:deazaflavin-dependent oxidoreductase (nitroreductase family)
MPDPKPAKVRLPPRWFIRLACITHRRLYRWTGGRIGLWRPRPGGWGAMRLTTIGRRTGRARAVIVGSFEDGPNLVTMAMNGWGDPEPAWWLNLQAHPDVTVDLVDGSRQVNGRAAQGEECERLWAPLARNRQEPLRLRRASLHRDRSCGPSAAPIVGDAPATLEPHGFAQMLGPWYALRRPPSFGQYSIDSARHSPVIAPAGVENADLESQQQIRSEDSAGKHELTDGGLTPRRVARMVCPCVAGA